MHVEGSSVDDDFCRCYVRHEVKQPKRCTMVVDSVLFFLMLWDKIYIDGGIIALASSRRRTYDVMSMVTSP